MPVLGNLSGDAVDGRFRKNNTWGLGIFPMDVKKFTDSCNVPHMGWNTVRMLKNYFFQG